MKILRCGGDETLVVICENYGEKILRICEGEKDREKEIRSPDVNPLVFVPSEKNVFAENSIF